jgi:AcrR family transcriptional regulator
MVTDRALRTRATLQACALDLFTTQGYDATTVEQIAAAAGVSHMTFFRHFPTKESVLVEDPYDPLIADAVRAQPRDLPALERVRRGILATWSAVPLTVDEETHARVSLTARHEKLRAKAWENTRETERVIVEALVESGTPRLEALVAAGACLGALMATLFDWGTAPGTEPLGGRIVAALEQLAPPEAPSRNPLDAAALDPTRNPDPET